MALTQIPIRPGVFRDDTEYSVTGRIVDCDKARIWRGRIQKIGGWSTFNATPLNGICRGIHAWNSFTGEEFEAFGTHTHLELFASGQKYDITPPELQSTNTLSGPFSTTAGSVTVNVAHSSHGRIAGETVYFYDASAVGGIIIYGGYAITRVVDIDNYEIEHDSAATGADTGGGTVTYRYHRATLTDPFSTTSGEETVEVDHAAHGRSVGDRVIFDSATAVGGITIDGEYTVSAVIDADTYEIVHSSAATSTAGPGGGTVGFTYLIPVGNETTAGSGGYGTGAYGAGPYGTSATTGAADRARTWSFGDMNGRLYANPRGLSIYEWSPARTNARACPLPNAPAQVFRCFVTPERFVVAAGCTDTTGAFDPLNVRISDQNIATTWTPASTNRSRFYRLNEGNAIISASAGARENLIWTDQALYAMRFSVEYVYVYETVGTGCGSAGPNAAIEKDGRAFWWGTNGNFYVYSGGVPQVIRCPIRDYVRKLLSPLQEDKIYAYFDSQFTEVGWLYPSGDSNECSRYLMHNWGEGNPEESWMDGTFDRTARHDRDANAYPIAVNSSGMVFFHEVGTSANGAAFTAYATLAPFEIGEGNRVANIRRYVPDVEMSGTLFVTFLFRRFPNGPLSTKGPYVVMAATDKIDLRFQGRQIQMKFESSGDGDFWRFGTQRLDIRQGVTR